MKKEFYSVCKRKWQCVFEEKLRCVYKKWQCIYKEKLQCVYKNDDAFIELFGAMSSILSPFEVKGNFFVPVSNFLCKDLLSLCLVNREDLCRLWDALLCWSFIAPLLVPGAFQRWDVGVTVFVCDFFMGFLWGDLGFFCLAFLLPSNRSATIALPIVITNATPRMMRRIATTCILPNRFFVVTVTSVT